MKIFMIIIFLVCVVNFGYSQQRNRNESRMVGFGCYKVGEPTKAVVKVTTLLNGRNYEAIASLLDAENPAERCLAVIALERLVQLTKFELTEAQSNLISKAKNSQRIVWVCSGCTYFDRVTMQKMFSKDNFLGSQFWLDDVIGNSNKDTSKK
ncbi:hypothetical protein [Chryseolinea lacunae]|uniref:HEAT repeat domain-containing protein n=1 Tax=Chryseolinea lacunae TaxID=2801331 RepID=A0ABS1KPR3_9BACT|nr:hypothetical protein [Chryseolinea lacunae]MBL0741460.1 hypothetical protein [Chryseolinea lacunae]